LIAHLVTDGERRPLYDSEHEAFRHSFRAFLESEVVPHLDEWERDGIVPRDVFRRAGAHGFVGMAVPEEYGGAGVSDFRFNAVIGEEVQRAGATAFGLGLTLHNDICLPYFLSYCTVEQRERWLPGIATAELWTAVAMTEPGTGSDLSAIATRAERSDDGWTISGAKTFITNGINADLVITAARTDASDPHRGLTLFVVEREMEGFARGRNLEKIGQHGQDTAELFFDGVFVPDANVLGEIGAGFRYLVSNLAQERLSIAIQAQAAARAAHAETIAYVRERQAFGKAIGSFQNTQFVLAELHAELEVGQAFIDRCVEALDDDRLAPEQAAVAKLWCTEMQGRVVDRCLQLFGGYGYMAEYPIARRYVDARATRIYGGTSEIMKEIIGRSLRLEP